MVIEGVPALGCGVCGGLASDLKALSSPQREKLSSLRLSSTQPNRTKYPRKAYLAPCLAPLPLHLYLFSLRTSSSVSCCTGYILFPSVHPLSQSVLLSPTRLALALAIALAFSLRFATRFHNPARAARAAAGEAARIETDSRLVSIWAGVGGGGAGSREKTKGAFGRKEGSGGGRKPRPRAGGRSD